MAVSQSNRFAKVISPLPDDTFVLTRLTGEESLSNLYWFELELASPPDDSGAPRAVAFDEVVGHPMTVALQDVEGDPRHFHGIVSHLVRLGEDDGTTTYRAVLVPWLWQLTLDTRCRIFENLTVSEIAKEVFADFPESDVVWAGESASGAPRHHTVQYRESDFDFVARLLEQEGTFWWFVHGEGKADLHLGDASSQSSACPALSDPFLFAATKDDKLAPATRITGWTQEQGMISGSWVLRDWNYHDPGALADSEAKAKFKIGRNERFVRQDYPAEYVKRGAETDAKQEHGDAWAALRMREEEAGAVVFRGRGESPRFGAGTIFELRNHFADDGKYLVTSLRHEILQPLSIGLGQRSGGEETKYHNEFTCIPEGVPYVPPRRTPRPEIRGPQTAVVVSDEEKDAGKPAIDATGRVKVNFHWNYGRGTTDESSCWVRVSQGWAGAGWGSQFHPRVGHEVVVEFLEGDPDRPLIVGRVYNAANEPPYPNPAETGFKSRTLDGTADNFNEIRFKDEKGSEEFHIQAEKDWTILVKNDEVKDVGANRTESVGENATISIGSDRSEKVGSNRSLEVGEAKTENVGAAKKVTVGGDLTESVGKAMSVTVAKDRKISTGGSLVDETAKDVTRSAGAALSESVGKDASLSVSGNYTVSAGKGGALSVKQSYAVDAKKVQIEGQDEISLKSGKAEIVLKKNGDITISGKKIQIKGSGDVVIKGSKVVQN
jgi:type VI secretion system secreted protein VgrG